MADAPIILSRPNTKGLSGSAHSKQLLDPASCSTEQTKVDNLRRLVADLDDQLKDVMATHDKAEFLSKAELISGFIMETSIGFLDMSAALLTDVNPRAAQVAKVGVASIRTTKEMGDLLTGQTNVAQFTANTTNHALGAVNTKNFTMAQKEMLAQAKKTVSGVIVVVEDGSGADKEKVAKAGKDFARTAATESSGIMADALTDGGMTKSGTVLKSLNTVESVYNSAMGYQDAVDRLFKTRLDQQMEQERYLRRAKNNIASIRAKVESSLAKAVDELNSCLAG